MSDAAVSIQTGRASTQSRRLVQADGCSIVGSHCAFPCHLNASMNTSSYPPGAPGPSRASGSATSTASFLCLLSSLKGTPRLVDVSLSWPSPVAGAVLSTYPATATAQSRSPSHQASGLGRHHSRLVLVLDFRALLFVDHRACGPPYLPGRSLSRGWCCCIWAK